MPPNNFGWVQSDAVIGKTKREDEERLVRLVQASEGFEQMERATLYLENFPNSPLRTPILLLLGDLAEESALKLSTEATRRLEKELPNLLKTLSSFRHLKMRGLMIIPPYDEDVEKVRPFFRRLRELRDEYAPNGELSMGMSHDYETAIEEGATLVRVGTAIFGARNYQN